LKRTLFALIGLLMSLIIVSIVLAVPGFDDRGVVNDPRVNERANACYDGGTLEGKCHTQVEWDAGWYLIRFQFGLLGRGDIPEEYYWVLPSEETPAPTLVPSPTVKPLMP
jgi:hypothetical protein